MRFDSPQADRLTALVLLALGLALLWAGYSMDRLEFRRIHPASIPGLVPMILGVVLSICAMALYLSARDRPGDGAAEDPPSWGDLGLVAGWSILFALLLVGRLPFVAATAIYIAGFMLLFDRATPRPRRAVQSVVFGLVAAAAISALFRYGFLVRLP